MSLDDHQGQAWAYRRLFLMPHPEPGIRSWWATVIEWIRGKG